MMTNLKLQNINEFLKNLFFILPPPISSGGSESAISDVSCYNFLSVYPSVCFSLCLSFSFIRVHLELDSSMLCFFLFFFLLSVAGSLDRCIVVMLVLERGGGKDETGEVADGAGESPTGSTRDMLHVY